jgi:predicted ArsR family transcriptional regulator
MAARRGAPTPFSPTAFSPAAWSVLMSPVRSEVAEALRLLGPSSVADIAHTLDRPADTLYRHLAALKRAGFVREVGLRKRGRNAELLFELTANDFEPDFSGMSKAEAGRVVHRAASSLLKAMDRTVRDAAAAHAIETQPATRNIALSYELGWLTPTAYAEARSLLLRLKALMDEGKTRRAGQLYMTLAIACPVVRKRGAGRGSAAPLPDASPPAAVTKPARTRKPRAPAAR